MLFCKEVSATTERDSSADTAAWRLVTSVDKLDANDSSPETREDASAESADSIDDFKEASPEIRLETSVDITFDTFVSMEVTAESKPEISAITRPSGLVIVALVKIKSDCLFKTILVFDIIIYHFLTQENIFLIRY
jgi:hypothetical protein